MRTIGRLLSDAVARSPDAVYLIAGEEEYSFQEFRDRSVAAALALWAGGVTRSGRVAVVADNDPRFLFTWFGLSLMGATLIPLDPSATSAEMAGLVRRADPHSVVVDEAHMAKAGDAVAEANVGCDLHSLTDITPAWPVPTMEDHATPGDVALMLPTSGTTSASKLVMQTHRGMVLAGEGFPWWIGLQPSDRVLAALPLFHLNALAYSTLGALSVGASLVLLPRFSASRFLSQARYYRATQFNSVGALLEILMRQPERSDDADNPLRLCYAAPAPPTRQRHLQIERRFGFEITAGYALSETPYGTIWPRAAEQRPYGSLGKLRQHPELGEINEGKVVDEAGAEVRPGDVGELFLRNPAVMAGYFGMETETK
ncbi:MAG TPA: AMP-binding protein, partial [Candidatus Eisenbacteria bacterium]|nr:AMP-binding protein [Candidatus Eisenbacteria bacterium]